MDYKQKFESLEKRVAKLEQDKNILESLLITKVPDWAREPLSKISGKEIQYPFLKPNTFGSYDYYRIIALLVNNNII